MDWLIAWKDDIFYTFEKCFIREDRYMLIVDGIGVTVKIALLAAFLGVLIGFLIACCNLSNNKVLNTIGKVYTDVIRGTPFGNPAYDNLFYRVCEYPLVKVDHRRDSFCYKFGCLRFGNNPRGHSFYRHGSNRSRTFARA